MPNNFSRRNFLLATASSALIPLVLPNESTAQTKDDCIFCKFGQNKAKYFKVWEDKDFLAFLDHKPINPGHTLLIPKKHFEYVFDLDKKNYTKILEHARELSKPLKIAMDAKRIGVIVEGFGVNHVHIHLVPLKGGGELLKKGAVGVTDDEFAIVTDKIVAQVKVSSKK